MAILFKPELGYKKVYGVFVGVEDYENIGDLQYSVDDAIGVYHAFFPELEEVRLLTEKEASRENVLNEVNRCLRQAGQEDLIILYLAGHGAIKHNDYFFLPQDADQNNILGTGISANLLVSAFSTVVREKGANVLFIFDSCHAGAVEFNLAKYSGAGFGGGISCLFAASPLEYAMEKPFGDRGHGVFSYYLMEGLNGKAAKKGENHVTLRGLFNYVYFETQKAFDGKQNPLLVGTLANDMVLKTLNTPHHA